MSEWKEPAARWAPAGAEPDLADMLADPIVRLVMRRDGLCPADVMVEIQNARMRLRGLQPSSHYQESIPNAAE